MTPGELSILLDDAAMVGIDQMDLADQWKVWAAAQMLLRVYHDAVEDGDRSALDIMRDIEEIA